MAIPEVHHATTLDGVSIAFQVVGSGPPDIVFINSLRELGLSPWPVLG